jgi:hypothetical protein
MFKFYYNALKGSTNPEQRRRVLTAALRCASLKAYEVEFMACRIEGSITVH